MPARRIMIGYSGAMALLATAYFALPAWHVYTWGAIGLTSTAAIVTGTVRNRPSHRLPWLMYAAGMLLFTAGDTTYNVMTDLLGDSNPFPGPADGLYLSVYPLLAGGLIVFTRLRGAGRNRGRLLDAMTLTVGLTLLSWIFLMVPYIRDPELTLPQKLISVGYPVGDILLFATLVRLLGGGLARTRIAQLLTFGTAGLLVSDVIYGLIQLHGDWQVGGPVDLGWLAFYWAWGAAALHPSMVRLAQPATGRPGEVSNRQLVLLTTSTLIAPAALIVEAGTGRVQDAPVIAALCGVTFLMVLARLSEVVATHRRALGRERALREAGAALVGAAGPAEVTRALRKAVRRLLPAGTPHRVFVAPAADAPTGALVQPLSDGQSLVVVADRRRLGDLGAALEVLASQAVLALARVALTAEVSRRDSEAYFRTLVHSAADVILIVDAEDRIRYASPSAAAVFGVADPVGECVLDSVAAEERTALAETLAVLRLGAGHPDNSDWRVVRPDGTTTLVEATYRDLRADPTVAGLVLTLRDVTERRRLEQDLAHQAFHDSLTGLANRVLFTDRVGHALTRAGRTGGLAGVLFVDLDDFKVINDTVGHGTGDELLVAVARRLAGVLRPHDTAARLGGDEFAILVEDALHVADVEEIADRVVRALAEPFVLAAAGGPVTVSGAASVGVATSADATSAAELLSRADLALYMAKDAGKGRWSRYQSRLHTELVRRLELRSALDQAVHEGGFALHYQPIVELPGAGAVGFEALARWPHSTLGLIPPGEFIELAEESGLIVPLGAWVLDEALQAVARWRDLVPPDRLPYVSVNVSVRQFRTPGFVAQVHEALRRHDVPPSALVLEITESLLLRDDEQVWADLTALRESGVRIAVDDFGTGYSSLSYLRMFPVDVLKVDKSFIDDMVSSPRQRAVVEAIVRLADTLELTVVAEGIEEPAHRELLFRMGCPLGQGYLFSRPVPETEVGPWLPVPGDERAALPAA